MKKVIRVKVPASTSNLGPGFDLLGLALQLYNEVEVERRGEGLEIEIEGEGEKSLPRNGENPVFRGIKAVFRRERKKLPGLFIREKNKIPPSRGLGSSGSAWLAGIISGYLLLGKKFSSPQILELAFKLEGHPDNIGASFLGGLVIYLPPESRWIRLPFPPELKIVVGIPDFPVATQKAREILPSCVSLSDSVFNLSRMGILISSLLKKKWDLIFLGTQDRLHQPYRKRIFPWLEKVFASAKEAGALGVFLSGAGPSVGCFSRGEEKNIALALEKSFSQEGISSRSLILGVDEKGARWEVDEI